MTKRDMELTRARVDGYHGDAASFTRHLVERRLASYQAMQQAYRAGQRQRAGGIQCGCYQCNKGGTAQAVIT